MLCQSRAAVRRIGGGNGALHEGLAAGGRTLQHVGLGQREQCVLFVAHQQAFAFETPGDAFGEPSIVRN